MECKKCKRFFIVEEFWEHVIPELSCKHNTQSELDALKIECKEAKEKLAKLEETTADNEVSLKAEIKFLLGKLMKAEKECKYNIKTERSKSILKASRREDKENLPLQISRARNSKANTRTSKYFTHLH